MRKYMLPLAAAAALVAAPATAQLVGGGLVVVNVSNVANNLAQNLKVNVSQIPVTVQVPVGVAAAVCGVDANVLAQQRKNGDATCTAQNSSRALQQATLRQLVGQ